MAVTTAGVSPPPAPGQKGDWYIQITQSDNITQYIMFYNYTNLWQLMFTIPVSNPKPFINTTQELTSRQGYYDQAYIQNVSNYR